MAKIPLTNGYNLIPEGIHIFKIVEVTYDQDFGKLEVKMVTASGQKYSEKFKLLDKDGQPNEKALNAFSYFAKVALNQFDVDEIDHSDLVGHYLKAEVVHTKVPSNKDPNKEMTFCNLGDKAPADGFFGVEDEPRKASPAAAAAAPAPATNKLDLDELLK